ncbi:hypothetical protein PUR61_16520 [Streptomyces sp. BE20]|uniref:hypothetical protein n=1 Tax=Streptomyces sp. BE20 TaxID=3002525 RepID=UPI002E7A4CFA|nr:hypothetical protein [Streptomyces sp. BE20]MEE1823783.1 hypothetical protein [Streptomyces sp. BE20]
MTTPEPVNGLVSAAFADDELVFSDVPGQIPGVEGPRFGRIESWPADCVRRPANRARGEWKLVLPPDVLWNLRIREVLFCLLHPTHRRLRDAGIFLGQRKWSVATAVTRSQALRLLAKWAVDQNMPEDLGDWTDGDWQAFIDHRSTSVGSSNLQTSVLAVRHVIRFSPVLTGTSAVQDPWPGQSAMQVANVERSDDLATESIDPEVWWPLLRAAWAYINRFAPAILDQRDREAELRDTTPVRAILRPGQITALLDDWLADPANSIPVSDRDARLNTKGMPLWTAVSRAVTSGRSENIFDLTRHSRAGARGTLRREKVIQAAQEPGRTYPVHPRYGVKDDHTVTTAPYRSAESVDAVVLAWLEDPAHLIPVHAPKPKTSRGTPGEPVWRALERSIYGNAGGMRNLIGQTAGGQRRRGWILQAATDPARRYVQAAEAASQLRMIRAACYIFVAALSLMRDSEIQEIRRGALTQHYGAPALASRKVKKDSSRPRAHWWIIECVAQAIAVAERLSWHEEYLFAPLIGVGDPGARSADSVGIKAASDIDVFIATVNATRDLTGLEEIPAATVRPHMFRKTMSIIAAQEPDGEIGLGIQLKHAARRAMANTTTLAYGKVDAKWAKEFDTQLQTAAAHKLTHLLKARRGGQIVAVGPGAARFHAGLDRVNAVIEQSAELRAQVADERLEITLLRDEFADLHLGTVNHCMWNAPTAECQNQLPEEQRGQAPLLGACQPSRCRNSVLTLSNERIWRMEEIDLVKFLKMKLSKPLREQALARLAEVRSTNTHFDKLKGST